MSIFAPEAPTVRADTTVDQGVVDQSGRFIGAAAEAKWQGIEQSVGMGLQAHKERTVAGLQPGIDEDIQGYMDRAGAEGLTAPGTESSVYAVGQEASHLQQQTEGFFDAEEDPALMDAKARFATLAKAAEKGSISNVELEARVEARARELANRYPGYSKEVFQYAEQALGRYSSTVRMIEEQRRLVASQQAGNDDPNWMEKQYLQAQAAIAKDMDISNYYGIYGSPDQREQVLNQIELRTPLYQAAKSAEVHARITNNWDNMSQSQQNKSIGAFIAQEIVGNEHATSANQDLISRLGVSDLSALADVRSDPTARASTQAVIEQWAAERLAMMEMRFGEADNTRKEAYRKYINSMKDTYTNWLSGNYSAEVLGNQVSGIQSSSAIAYHAASGPAFDMMLGLRTLLGESFMNTDAATALFRSELGDHILAPLSDAYSEASGGKDPVLSRDMRNKSGESKNAVTRFLNSVVDKLSSGQVEEGATQEQVSDALVNNVLVAVGGLDDVTNVRTLTSQNIRDIFEVVARPDFNDLRKSHPSQVAKIEEVSAQFIDNYFMESVRGLRSAIEANPNLPNMVELGVTPTGTIGFVPKNDSYHAAAVSLNQRYHFGVLTKAYNNIYGTGVEDVMGYLSSRGLLTEFGVVEADALPQERRPTRGERVQQLEEATDPFGSLSQ